MNTISMLEYEGSLPSDLGRKSVRRNPLIAALLQRIAFIEKAGTGIKRMSDDARQRGYPEPTFEANGFFTATLLPITDQVEAQEPAVPEQPESRLDSSTSSVPVQYQSLEDRILALLNDDELPVSIISKRLGQSRVSGQLKVMLKRLLGDSLVEFTIPDKPNSRLQKYRITETGRRLLER